MLTQEQKDFIKLLGVINRSKSADDVFRDWLDIATISYRNTTLSRDSEQWKINEDHYMKMIGRYVNVEEVQDTPEDDPRRRPLNQMVELTGTFMLAHQDNRFQDFLGPISGELGMLNPRTGQFFTPEHISALMAKMLISRELVQAAVDKKGYLSVSDPAAGSGGMALQAAKVIHELGFEPLDVLVIHCVEIMRTSFMMCYLQMFASGVPAVVIHGDSLKLETFDMAVTYPLAYTWLSQEKGIEEPEKVVEENDFGQIELF